MLAAADAAESCDVFLSIGTSSLVYPAAGLAESALRAGATVIEVNPERTDLSRRPTSCCRGHLASCCHGCSNNSGSECHRTLIAIGHHPRPSDRHQRTDLT